MATLYNMKRVKMPNTPPAHTISASAKINLTLSVTGRDDKGYHKLVSAVAFTDFGDKLHLHDASDMRLDINGPFASELHCASQPHDDKADNLLFHAHKLAKNYAQSAGLPLPSCHHISLEKHIPIGGGLGGGSADAAAYLRFLSATWGEGHITALRDLSVTLGADVPACFDNHSHIMAGIGEAPTRIAPSPSSKDWPFMVITNPHCHGDTASVFKAYALSQTRFSQKTPKEIADIMSQEDWDRLFAIGNDLTDAACHLYPEIGTLLFEMGDLGRELGSAFIGHAMSGSGASCFALFTTDYSARSFQQACQERGFWSVQTRFF